MTYEDKQMSLFMDTCSHLEAVRLYVHMKRDFKKGDCPGITLTRKMAYALMKEIESRLFVSGEVKHGTIKEDKKYSIFRD